MLIEDTPSGNLRLYSPENPEAGIKMTRADVRAVADLFALLDRWDQEGDFPEEITGKH